MYNHLNTYAFLSHKFTRQGRRPKLYKSNAEEYRIRIRMWTILNNNVLTYYIVAIILF